MLKKCECGDIHHCPAALKERGPSYIDDAVIVLRRAGRTMDISEIVYFIRQRRDDDTITRASVETSLLRHIAKKGESTVLVKAGRGTYSVRP
jgi:hypothetical protein